MQSNELRLGNYLYYRDKDKLLQVSNLGSQRLETVDEDGITYGSDNISDYNPIPLTKEWLLKLGFSQEYRDDEYWKEEYRDYICDAPYATIRALGGNYYWLTIDEYFPAYSYMVKHIHQLQNLYFALTGEEVTLQP